MRTATYDSPEYIVAATLVAQIPGGLKQIFYPLLLTDYAKISHHKPAAAAYLRVSRLYAQALQPGAAAQHVYLLRGHTVAADSQRPIAFIGDEGEGAVAVGLPLQP